jgi:hypothetical protein
MADISSLIEPQAAKTMATTEYMLKLSIAISLKRIADKLEQVSWPVENGEAFQIINRS